MERMFGVALEELHEVIGRIQAEAAEVTPTRLSYDLFKVRTAIDKLESVSQLMLSSCLPCPPGPPAADVERPALPAPWIA
jgi:hypothetical protein